MKNLIVATLLATLLIQRANDASAGQAAIMSAKDFVDGALLVGVVKVTKVSKIEVPTLRGQISNIYVAEAEIVETVKNDYPDSIKQRRIAIVASTVPRSSAVWQPIEEGTYLAFLKRAQGHYHYQFRYAFRKVDENNKVNWIDYQGRKVEFAKIDLQDAVKRLRGIQAELHAEHQKKMIKLGIIKPPAKK
jgi:hypothetical protein